MRGRREAAGSGQTERLAVLSALRLVDSSAPACHAHSSATFEARVLFSRLLPALISSLN